jgi:hypothetical protein
VLLGRAPVPLVAEPEGTIPAGRLDTVGYGAPIGEVADFRPVERPDWGTFEGPVWGMVEVTITVVTEEHTEEEGLELETEWVGMVSAGSVVE